VALSASRFDIATTTFVNRVVLVNSDGSNLQSIADASLLGGVAANAVPVAEALDKTYAIFVASPVTQPASQAGATVRAIALDSRSTLVTYGTLPATPAGLLFPSVAGPFQYTQPGLLAFIGTSGSGAIDLYYFDSDAAGLVRVTNFVTDTPSAAPATARQRAAIRRALQPSTGAAGVGSKRW
jgi:hypothetical protein